MRKEPHNVPIRIFGSPIPSLGDIVGGVVSLGSRVGRVVRRARRGALLSRRQLARRAGISVTTLRAIEADRGEVSTVLLGRIAHAAGCRLEIRMERTECGVQQSPFRERRKDL